MSGPVWMYRKGEAQMFASPGEVPEGEGWVDTPVPADDVPAESEPVKRKPGRPRKVVETETASETEEAESE